MKARVYPDARPPRRSSRSAFAVLVGIGLLAASVPGLKFQGGARVLLRGGGITVERFDSALAPRGVGLGADEGDLVLSNSEVKIVVGASPEPGARKLEYGAIIDLTGPGFTDDSLGRIRTVAQSAGRRLTLVTDGVFALSQKNLPELRVVQRDADRALWVTTDIVLDGHAPQVRLSSRVENRGARPIQLRLGDDVEWPGVPTFAPGYGDVEDQGQKSLSWMGRRGPLAYGLVFPDAPADIEFRAHQSETEQTAWAPSQTLAPGESTTYRRVLLATPKGLSEVARLEADLTGRALGSVVGVLRPAPGWAVLTAIASDGTIAMKETSRDDGTFELALRPGRYTVLLQTPGGFDQAALDVDAGPRPTVAHLVVPQAERLDFRITNDEGQLIPARLMVEGVEGTPDPRFLSVPKVAAAQNEVHSLSGEGHVDIPQGRYRVTVSRGVEWSIVQKVVDVKPSQGVALRVALTHEVKTPGWISADLHLHAKPSRDSELSLDDRIAGLVAAGVEFAVASDHNHVTDYAPYIEAAGAGARLSSVRGVEITTRTWGHFNAYPLPPKAQPPTFTAEPAEMFAAARALGPDVVIQVNHPWVPGYGYFHRAVLNEKTGAHWRKHFSFDFDLLEVVNGYEFGTSNFETKNLRRYFDLLNLGKRYTAVGSSDSHKLTNEWAGYPRTFIRVKDDRPDHVTAVEIARELRAGHATVSIGPIVDARIGESGPGDTVQVAKGTVPLSVTVRAPDWVSVNRVDIVVNGDIVESYDATEADRDGSVRWSRTVDVPIQYDSFVVAVAYGDRPLDIVLPGRNVMPFAFTNPIWVDVGESNPEPASKSVHRAANKTELPPAHAAEVEPPAPETESEELEHDEHLDGHDADGGVPELVPELLSPEP
jgi:hypothetical protein